MNEDVNQQGVLNCLMPLLFCNIKWQ